ncbi:MAG: transcription-repair coupling factor [Pseudonocardiaceae bacterium]
MTSAHLSGLLEAVLPDPALRELVERAGTPTLELQGPSATRPLVVAALCRADHPVLAVTATDREASELTSELTDLLGGGLVAELPSWETLPHERLSPRADTVGRRLAAFRRLAHPDESEGPLRVLVATVRSLIQPMIGGLGEIIPVRLRVGEEHDFDSVLARLADLAYSRVDMVDRRGEFAVRGGIVDVFPPTADHPLRVEFWGEEVSEIRSFAVADQRSLAPAAELHAPPCRELLLTDAVRARAAQLAAHAPAGPLGELLEKVSAGVPAEGMESLIPVLAVDEHGASQLQLLTDVMPRGTHVVLADPERIRTRAADLLRTGEEFLEASWMVAAGGGAAPVDVAALDLSASAYRGLREVAEHALGKGVPWWTLSPLITDVKGPLHLDITSAQPYHGDLTRAFADLRAHTATGAAAVLVVPGAGTAQRACEQLRDAEVPAVHAADGLSAAPAAGTVTVVRGALENGFLAPAMGLAVLTETDITGARGGTASQDMRRMPVRRRNAVDPLALQPGDHVVHEQHGIGRFVEMVERSVKGAAGSTREYLLVEYAPSKRGHPPDRLFIPTDQLDQITRYVGGELPTLSKLGGSDWAKTKSRARKAVKEIAADLVALYAARQSAPGHPFGPDTPWQAELEDAFPYTETADQLAAIDEVKTDMSRAVPMDRVICGDVGYGKTEIAVRAAFKAVQDGKQVALLVPTTLLAQQHLQTFTERMRPFPVTVRGLSRFTHSGDVADVMAGLADGSVDIVIGTHRLLQTGVRWKDLGLVVVDEEQRFGVEHKEHIKALRTAVDVLTLSATPIPRTLEMSLAGIREMSTILTPPEERHPVLTYVGAYDDKQVGAAIRRELLRDGQVFYVHNRVSSIEKAARRIRELVGEARVAVAHGQMNEDILERTVASFWEREIDVLVCTTIVETGLDISNANTLIVERGDLLGLAQLHQLRGRVGRGRERGYAYFMYPPETALTETAHDRLATIAQHTELGAGMAVAMKDLEIRGAGNILGGEQSGHIAGVGFDLYIRLVGEAVAAFRTAAGAGSSDTAAEPAPVRVELPVDAHLPHDYIPGERLRLEAYRKIAEAVDTDGLTSVTEELVDRYGTLPPPVVTLLDVARFRQVCRAHGVSEVTVQGSTLRFSPVQLRDSQMVRLARLYPKAVYKPAVNTLSMPRPREDVDRVGAPQLRDRDLLDWCTRLVIGLLGHGG